MENATCQACGETFLPRHGNQKKYCSRRCSKQASQALYRHRYRDKIKAERIRFDCECQVCGAFFRATRQAIYCTSQCEGVAKSQRYTGVKRPRLSPQRLPVLHPTAGSCSVLPRRHPVRLLVAPPKVRNRVWVAGPCASCGTLFVFNQPQARVCSAKCARRVSRKAVRARHGRLDVHRKRARFFGVEYEPISPKRVFEQDGWRCGICGRRTLKGKKVPHPRAATLDHVIPMSLGGGHIRANVQCACFECNTRKGVHGSAQLRLIA